MGATCKCKGVRACALCEHDKVASHRLNVSRIGRSFLFCSNCSICFEVDSRTGRLGASFLKLAGIEVAVDVITEEHELVLINALESTNWLASQSGRQKQDFGPKVNFKKKKVKTDTFLGFPSYMSVVQQSFSNLSSLSDFVPVELCNLKYSPERGACIDPHLDDSWLWGERLVTLNLLGKTVLTFSQVQDFADLAQPSADPGDVHYALSTETLFRASRAHCCIESKDRDAFVSDNAYDKYQPMDVVHVLLPRRSLVSVAKTARSEWHHSILREHVSETRLAMTCRELSKTFLEPSNAEFEQGQILLKKAQINLSLVPVAET